jgi:hypothetical protein
MVTATVIGSDGVDLVADADVLVPSGGATRPGH